MLPRLAFFAALCSIFLSPCAVRAHDLASAIIGVWKVVSIETKEVQSGKITHPLGDQLTGTFVFTPGGRFSGMVFSANRKAPAVANATEAERLALFNSLVAYNGVYRTEGDRLIMTIESSHNSVLERLRSNTYPPNQRYKADGAICTPKSRFDWS
jgi:hypothetical protein